LRLAQTYPLLPYTTLFRSGRAVDLVGEQEVREDGALAERELGGPRVVHERARDVAGHEVGRELHALGAEVERRRERAHEQRLGRSEEHTSELQSRENLVCR